MPPLLLIVGASLAGTKAAQAARSAGFAGDLAIVGDESHRPYDRPPLSKQLLSGESTEAGCALPISDLDADWRLGEAATALHLEGREVELTSGERLGFDRLVIATGSRARRWPGPGAGLPGVMTLRGLDDATRMAEALRQARRLAVVGAGFLGCEIAASARALGLDVWLIDIAERPMGALGAVLGEHCASLHRERGVELRMAAPVEAMLGDERVEGVRLADGETIEVDLVCVALGSEPNVEWLEDSALTLRRGGVLCDHHLAAVGVDSVWCAGDICTWSHPSSIQGSIRVEHWANAAEQGATAGRNAVVEPRERRPFGSLPSFWSDQHGVRFQAVGFPAEATDVRIVERSPAGDRMVAIGSREGQVVAALGVDAARRLPWYRRQIVARAEVKDVLAELEGDAHTLSSVGEGAVS